MMNTTKGITIPEGSAVRITIDDKVHWSKKYTLTYRHSYSSSYHSSSDTGPMDQYAMSIDGVIQDKLGAFSNSAKTYTLPYGTKIAVAAAVASGSDRSYVTLNGNKVAGSSSLAYYEFTLTSNIDIHFEWNYFLSGILNQQSYWLCYITT